MHMYYKFKIRYRKFHFHSILSFQVIIEKPPDKIGLSENFTALSSEINDIFILGDMNINAISNGVNFLNKNINFLSDSTPIESIRKKYKAFCSTFSLLQIMTQQLE